jgi:hypothetical protein
MSMAARQRQFIFYYRRGAARRGSGSFQKKKI